MVHIKGLVLFFPMFWLGLGEAEFWIGPSEVGTKSNNYFVFVVRRILGKLLKFLNKRPNGISAVKCKSKDGYYELDTSNWPDGFYRLNAHGKRGEYSSLGKGTKLGGKDPDYDYSWASIQVDDELSKSFIYKEPNGRGYCIRVEKKGDKLLSAGNI